MKFYIKKIHIITNLLGFLISGISGVAINILIIRLYNSEVLGLFHQIIAIFFILSQITTFGVHLSVLSNIPTSDCKEIIFISAFFTVLLVSITSSLLLLVIIKYIFITFGFEDLSKALYFIIPSLVFFSLNKVMINTLNAQSRLNLFAVANSIRLTLMIIGILLHYYFKWPVSEISSVLIFSESVIFLFLITTHLNYFVVKTSYLEIYHWSKAHISFGKYALFSGLIIELNTKIDIIILSIFVDQRSIGIYSFAATLGEGFYLLISIFKNLNSSNASNQLLDTSDKKLSQNREDDMKNILIFIYSIGFISILAYQLFAWLATGDKLIVVKGFWVYVVYATTLILSAKYLLIDNILILANKPHLDNKVRLWSLLSNLLLSIVLVPLYGIYGAVLALAFSVLVNALLLKYFYLKFNLNST
ncbi:polysaccharide biosynthesis C-terminal domain-containing protein [Candidatus Tisiphia endosymbiont of Nemotelus uliginosus]|uniref:polysaccharide biosynthesis C-terminal domain-containing protein n=1 Tax=Candidatus Tisiphia endosymbiont of Nemotelus uliginosus TaxID=3077926 RepID=UPI0035C8CA99